MMTTRSRTASRYGQTRMLSSMGFACLVVEAIRTLFSFIFMPQNSGVLGIHNLIVGKWLLNNALNPQGL